MRAICDDLVAEQSDLDALVRGLASWERPTPAEGWSIGDEISHLCFFDGTAVLALTDPAAFAVSREALLVDGASGRDPSVEFGRSQPASSLLIAWRRGRAELVEVLRPMDPRARVPWYGPDMSARSFATARLMETSAHGQDVADALGVRRQPTARLRHIAHLGVTARPFAYRINGADLPESDIRVELVAPDGAAWEWGSREAVDSVRGDALDFCLVVTRRRHVSDTGLAVEGEEAARWMTIAQAFAGPPGSGRRPGQFSRA